MSASCPADLQTYVLKVARIMRQPLVKERQDSKCSVVARQALHAVLAQSYVRGEWARI